MRDDLLNAQASIDWAIAQTKVLGRSIAAWRRSRPYVAIIEPDSQPGKEVVKAKLNHPLPLTISAEAGAIVHMTRSSLDILAVALAERNGHVRPEDVYFPVAKSAAEFGRPKHGAIEKIAKLSDADRLTIEQLKPYHGGDDVLFSLHRLDVLRKHQRLLSIPAHAQHISMFRAGTGAEPDWIIAERDLKDGSPLARVPIGANYNVQISPEVTFNETPFGNGRPVLECLRAFAERAINIIKLFDT